MKPRFVHNWPNVKEDNDILANRIKSKIEEYRTKDNASSERIVRLDDSDRKSKEDLFKNLNVK
jgi:hypothetical protein